MKTIKIPVKGLRLYLSKNIIIMLVLIFAFSALYAESDEYKGKPQTIAHDFLEMEKKVGSDKKHIEHLDSIINKIKSGIIIKKDYSTVEAVKILNVIYLLLKKEGFEFKPNNLLSIGLDSKRIDCDNYSAIYTAIAEVTGLPIIPVNAPNHSFIRFNFNDGTYLNWEPAEGSSFPDAFYIKHLKISGDSIKKGVYLKSLQRKEFIGVGYNNIGAYLMKRKKYSDALPYFAAAIKLYPLYSSAFHNNGSTLYALKRAKDALKYLKIANSLDSMRPGTHNTLGDIYFDLKSYDKAVAHYKKSISLNPNNYVPYYSIGLVMKAKGNEELAYKWINKSSEVKRKFKK